MTEPASLIVQADEAYSCDVTFFVACYNEEANIVSCLDNLTWAAAEAGRTYDIIVVDDASTDRSAALIQQYMQQHSDVPIKLLVNASNQGIGANYAEAAFHGSGKYYRVICGDDEERRETIAEVLRHLGEADMILTYHHDPRERPLVRRVISRAFTMLTNLVSGHRLKYYNGLAVHRRYDVMRWHSYAHGFGFQADLITRLLDMGATYLELPVVPKQRQQGRTKAFTFRNVCSVGHTFIEIFIRRMAHAMYPRYRAQLSHAPTGYVNPAFRAREAATTAAATGEPVA